MNAKNVLELAIKTKARKITGFLEELGCTNPEKFAGVAGFDLNKSPSTLNWLEASEIAKRL